MIQRLRVLLVHPHIFAGGAEKAIIYLAHHLNKLGHNAAVCTLSTKLDDLPPIANSLTYLTPQKTRPPSKLGDIGEAMDSVIAEVRALRRLAFDNLDNFDLLSPCNFPAYWSTWGCRRLRPTVWICSEVFGPYNASRDLYERSRLFRLMVNGAESLDRYLVTRSIDEIVTCSDLNSQLIKERYGLDAVVIPTGVDYGFFSEGFVDAKQRLSLDDSYVLLHVGALVKRKNHILSVRALHRLKRIIPNTRLIIVGDGPWQSVLKEEVRELGLSGDVLFAGSVSEEKLRLFYHACDLNLYPVEDQTYGLVPFEAFAAGKPSLVTEHSGAGLLMAREGLGYLIRPEVDSIVSKTVKIWRNGGEVERVVKQGRAYVRDNLTWDRYAARMAQLYQNVHDSCQEHAQLTQPYL